MLLHHPHLDETNYNDRDKAFRDKCCGIGFDVYCDKFFEQRIINNCQGYSPPAVGKVFYQLYWSYVCKQYHKGSSYGAILAV